MASKSSPQYTEHNDQSRIVLPCIGEDELLNQPAPSSRGSIPKTPRQRLRVNSEPIVSNAVKNTLIKSKDAVDDATAKSKMTTNRKVTRRGSVADGVSTEKDCCHGNTKRTRASRNAKQQVKLNTPSPDVIDLSNEDVVKELMIRLYKTLKVQDNSTYDKFTKDDCTIEVEETRKQRKPSAARRKPDSEISLFRHHRTRFPHVIKATSGLEVFYSKPASWKSLISSQQLQQRIRAKHFLAFQERSTKRNQEKMVQMNYRQLTWPFEENSVRPGRSTSILRKRGLSVPFIGTNGSAFVSLRMLKASRKFVTFAQ